MRSQLTFALCMAAASAAAIQQADPPASAAQKPANALPPSFDVGNLISTLTSTWNYLTKTLSDAGDELKKGASFSVVLDHTLPKILPEAKLFNRIELPQDRPIRPEAKKAKATFGPYTLVGKNVST
jgi:hypothetical protein